MIYFVCGLFVGCFAGIMLASMLIAAKQADEELARMLGEEEVHL